MECSLIMYSENEFHILSITYRLSLVQYFVAVPKVIGKTKQMNSFDVRKSEIFI